jgi:ferredoxin
MNQENELRTKAKELLASKRVAVVIGYGPTETGGIGAVFVTDPDQTDKLVWNERCTVNLTTYLKRKEIKKLGKAAIVVKGCDAKAIAVLELEKQLDRDSIYVIGMTCGGVREKEDIQEKCFFFYFQKPPHCDEVIVGTRTPLVAARNIEPHERYARLQKLMAMSTEERFEYWKRELARCIKCYACRQNCPMCYCEVCVADKNRPVRIDTSATLKGNLAWNILRAFHLAGRCVGCAACSTACPAGIDLDLLNLSLAKVAEEQFGFRAGMLHNVEPLIGTFSPDDKEEFIR